MGSSILASLSEAGGNDPQHRMTGPLPPRPPHGADRSQTSRGLVRRAPCIFKQLRELRVRVSDTFEPKRERRPKLVRRPNEVHDDEAAGPERAIASRCRARFGSPARAFACRDLEAGA